MRWFDRFKKKADEPECTHHYCQDCGGVKTRQTTLLEFDPHMLTPKEQKRITDYIPPKYTTERVGMQSDKRKYRGNV